MLKVRQILVTATGLVAVGVALSGCGQKGALFLPTDPAAAHRATLPGSLVPSIGKDKPEAADPAAKPAEPPVQPPAAEPAGSPPDRPASGAVR